MDTGTWVPQTMTAKLSFFAETCEPLTARARSGAGAAGFWLLTMLPASMGAIALPTFRLGRLGLLAMVASVAAYSWLAPSALWTNQQRYLYPILMPWVVLGFGRVLASRRRERGLILLGSLVFLTVSLPSRWFDRRPAADEIVGVARWLEASTPPDAVLMVQDAGAVSVFTTRQLVDIVGLKSALSLDAHRTITAPSCGADRGRALEVIARSSGASFLVTNAEWESLYQFTDNLRRRGHHLTAVRTPHPRLLNGYTVYRLDDARSGGALYPADR
jgi:hypothetical protein